MPLLATHITTTTTTTTKDASLRTRLAAAIAAGVPDGRPLATADRATAPTQRYRSKA